MRMLGTVRLNTLGVANMVCAQRGPWVAPWLAPPSDGLQDVLRAGACWLHLGVANTGACAQRDTCTGAEGLAPWVHSVGSRTRSVPVDVAGPCHLLPSRVSFASRAPR